MGCGASTAAEQKYQKPEAPATDAGGEHHTAKEKPEDWRRLMEESEHVFDTKGKGRKDREKKAHSPRPAEKEKALTIFDIDPDACEGQKKQHHHPSPHHAEPSFSDSLGSSGFARVGTKESKESKESKQTAKDRHIKHTKDTKWHAKNCDDTQLLLVDTIAAAYPFDPNEKKQHTKLDKLCIQDSDQKQHFGTVTVNVLGPPRCSCDPCGEHILERNEERQFYVCRSCRKNGGKLEMCLSCYEAGVLATGPRNFDKHIKHDAGKPKKCGGFSSGKIG